MQNVEAQFIAIDSDLFVQEFLKDQPDFNQHQSVILSASEEYQTPGTEILSEAKNDKGRLLRLS